MKNTFLVRIHVFWNTRILKFRANKLFENIDSDLNLCTGEVIRPLQQSGVWTADCLRHCNRIPRFLAKLLRYTVYFVMVLQINRNPKLKYIEKSICSYVTDFEKYIYVIILLQMFFDGRYKDKIVFDFFSHFLLHHQSSRKTGNWN